MLLLHLFFYAYYTLSIYLLNPLPLYSPIQIYQKQKYTSLLVYFLLLFLLFLQRKEALLITGYT